MNIDRDTDNELYIVSSILNIFFFVSDVYLSNI